MCEADSLMLPRVDGEIEQETENGNQNRWKPVSGE